MKAAAQTKTINIQNCCWREKSTELRRYADAKDMKNFYIGMKELYGPTKTSTRILEDKYGIILTNTRVTLKLQS